MHMRTKTPLSAQRHVMRIQTQPQTRNHITHANIYSWTVGAFSAKASTTCLATSLADSANKVYSKVTTHTVL